MMRKTYEELLFTDDFMFCKILTKRPDLCKKLLELILGIGIEKVEVQRQKAIEPTYDGRGVRLDVYAMGGDGTVYDIEMQTTRKADLPKRMRYYQGMMDLNLIERGARFSELKRSYIIFICTDDPFMKGMPVYTFGEMCREVPNLPLGDETHKIVVNAKGSRDGVTEEMRAFLDFVEKTSAESEFTKDLERAVKEAIDHDEWRDEYMTFTMRLNEEREEGREEGREQLVYEMVSDGDITVRLAAEKLSTDEDSVITGMRAQGYTVPAHIC